MKFLRSLFSAVAPLAALAFVVGMLAPGEAAAQCSGPNLVVLNSPGAGTQWRVCWEMRQREGLVISYAGFRARNDIERTVLFRASVAQVHVPYFNGSPRFRDVTTSTAGLGAGALNLTNTDCAPANRLTPQVCREFHDRGLAWKYGGGSLRGQEVTLWISSQLGQYNYLTQWTFRDDGTIEPKVGLTGRLQIVNPGAQWAPFGTPVDPPATNRYAINHIHSFYYRFDFDINGSADDAVEGLYYSTYTDPNPSFPGCAANPGLCGTNTPGQFFNEGTDRLYSGAPFVSWRVYDKLTTNPNGRTIGYEIVPVDNWQWYGEPVSEPWAQDDLYVTRYNFCEQLATDNHPPYIEAGCAGAQPDVLAMTSEGDDVDGQDNVIWVRTTFQHVAREEDQVNMPIEYHGLLIQPRSWRHRSTME